jgi:hypothetical protein
MKWKYIEYDSHLLDTLFNNSCFDEIYMLMRKKKNSAWLFNKEQFHIVIDNGEQLDLILYFLKVSDCVTLLQDFNIQKTIIEIYFRSGRKLYYGVEMLCAINPKQFNLPLLKTLCHKILRLVKNKEILNCHSLIVTCLLICEFMKSISQISHQYSAVCLNVVRKLGKFCKNIQVGLNCEEYIYFLMTQKDIKQRSAFLIAEKNEFFFVMETLEVELIVNKMWNGKISHNSFYGYSSLNNYLNRTSYIKGFNPFKNFEPMDQKGVYIFQLSLWFESCCLRHHTELISSLVLVLIYNIFLNFLTDDNKVMTKYRELSFNMTFCLYSYLLWVLCINLNFLNVYIFYKKLNKILEFRIMFIFDFLLLICSFSLLVDIEGLFGKINPHDEYKIPYIIKSIILGLNDFLVWFKVGSNLLTLREFGPIMRIIYLLSFATAKYLIIYLLFLFCNIAMFTAIFYKMGDESEPFIDYSQSLGTLFNGFVNVLNCYTFKSHKLFGGIALVMFVTMASFILMSVLTALQVNVFKKYNKLANSLHRVSLVRYYKRYKWDKEYGYLIFLPTPLSVISLIIVILTYPCRLTQASRRRLNSVVCKIYYLMLHFPIISVLQLIGELVFIPICYLKGIVFMFYHHQIDHRSDLITMAFGVMSWLAMGLPFILKKIVRDKLLVFKYMFRSIKDDKSGLKKSVKNSIDPSEIQTFLEFIHSRSEAESNDLQTLFQDYLDFDLKKKAEGNISIKEKMTYLDKLNEAIKVKENSRTIKTSIYLYKNTGSDSEQRSTLREFRRICKRNLLIIDVLEKFSIDESRDNQAVDIQMLTNLLPKTTVIDNSYLKRIIYTDIKALNKATKLKQDDIEESKTLLLEKTVKSSMILNKFMDNLVTTGKVLSPADIADKDDSDTEAYYEVSEVFGQVSRGIKEGIQQEIRAIISAFKENGGGGN